MNRFNLELKDGNFGINYLVSKLSHWDDFRSILMVRLNKSSAVSSTDNILNLMIPIASGIATYF